MTELQSIAFDKYIWTNNDVYDWLNYHGIIPMKQLHITKNYRRARITNPNKYKRIRALKRSNGIIFYYGYK